MSRLITVELKGKFYKEKSIDLLLNFLKEENAQYLFDEKLSITYLDKDNDIEHDYVVFEELDNKKVITLYATFFIKEKNYSLGFMMKSDTELNISFGNYKKIDNEFLDCNWVYKTFLKKIFEKFFKFHSLIYYDEY